MKNKEGKNIIKSLIISFLITCTFVIDLKYYTLHEYGNNLFHINYLLLVFAYIFIYKSVKIIIDNKKKLIRPKRSIISGLIIGLFIVIGLFYNWYADLSYMWKNIIQVLKSLYVFLGYSVILTYIIDFLLEKISSFEYKKSDNKIINQIFEKRSFLYPFILILIAYVPIMIMFFPGRITNDTSDELLQYYHRETWSLRYINLIDKDVYINGHHSPFHTQVIGCINHLVYKVTHNADLALFANAMIQSLLMIAILAYSINLCKKLKTPIAFRIILLLVYMFIPFFNVWSITVVKDVPFALTTLFMSMVLTEIVYLKDDKLKNILKYIILAIICFLLNKKGLFIILITTLLLVVYYMKNYKFTRKYIMLLIIPFLLYGFVEKVYYPMKHITPGSIQETLSLPIQQVSRYVIKYEDELTEKDINTINKIIPYNKIEDKYEPEFADPIKNDFNKNYKEEDLKDFFILYLELFRKHPLVYVDAFANFYYGNLYIFKTTGLAYFDYNTSVAESGRNNLSKNKETNYSITKTQSTSSKLVRSFYYLLRETPIFDIVLNCTVYVVVTLVLFLYILEKKNMLYVPFIPSLIVIAFLFVSPANNTSRYSLPIIYCLPFLITYVISISRGTTKKSTKGKGVNNERKK